MPSSSDEACLQVALTVERSYSSDEADENFQSAFFTIDVATFDLQPETQASLPITSPPHAASLDALPNPGYTPGISPLSEVSADDSSLGISITPADSSSSLSTSASSLPLAQLIQSTSKSVSSRPAELRRPIGRSASDSNFGAHGDASLAEGFPTHSQLDKSHVVGLRRLAGGRPKNSLEASIDAFKELVWQEEDDTIPETELFQVGDSLSYSDLSLLQQQHDYLPTHHVSGAAFRSQRIFYSCGSSSASSWSSLFKTMRQGGRSLLCSVCKQMSPVLRNVPRRFSYKELEMATNNFSKNNFLAEGGFGFVYKGDLDGQAIAVKQHKLASTQGYKEFRSEVELLSCAQHRNLVMLLGCCDENGHRMLVYEFVCNNSLDWHLSPTKNPKGLIWAARLKIAIGAARALRYLHEESRVGCIVHRDMRPNNILLTHDYEAMVGDFGLARSHPEGEEAIETRIIGTFGYLAPEYAESGQVSWRADVYAFGVVLLELITGRKAIDLLRPPGQQSLTEWARPKLLNIATAVTELVDSRLDNVPPGEMRAMMHAAFLCITKDPAARPRMNQVLHILEGEARSLEELPRPSIDVSSAAASKMSDSQLLNYSQQPATASLKNQIRKQQPGSGVSSARKARQGRLNYKDML